MSIIRLPRLRQRHKIIYPLCGGGGGGYFLSLGPHAADPFQQVDRCTSSIYFGSDVHFDVGTHTNESRVPSLSFTNEERWITANSFVLVHGFHIG